MTLALFLEYMSNLIVFPVVIVHHIAVKCLLRLIALGPYRLKEAESIR
jgi:hypothetical protein